jgi:hypothetical protein
LRADDLLLTLGGGDSDENEELSDEGGAGECVALLAS